MNHQCLHRKFIQSEWQSTREWHLVSEIADELIQYLCRNEVLKLIADANQPGKKSTEIQEVVLGKTKELGFVDESKGLFSEYKNNRLRPDYFKALENGTGILIEVERGKTNQNNMDLLDFWKCHICKHAHYLFLLVPNELKQNQSGRVVGRPFQTVVAHMETLFQPENYTNVRGVVVIGY
jgi:hypothetical protein